MSIAPSPTEAGAPDASRATPSCCRPSCTTCSSSSAARGSPAPCGGCTSPPPRCATATRPPGAALVELVRGLPQEEVEPCIRACALQLQLANIAEERERVRRRRHYDATGVRQRESLMEAADLLRDEGADLAAALRSLHVELVLTAHPTEATRRSVLDHQLRVARLLDGLDDPRIGRSRRRALLSELREALTIWWQTDEVRRVRPMVEDEVRRNLFFFEATLHDAVPEVLEELERCFEVRVDGRELAFGSWAGSDMDGHPEVGAETLARTLALHRRAALQLLRQKVDRLARDFSHSSRRVPVSPALEASLERDAAGAAVRARPAPREPRVRAAADQARLHHPPAREHARPARARARLQRSGGAARRPLARPAERRLRPRRARRPAAAAVADRRVRLPRREPRRAPVGVGGPGGGGHAAARLPRRRRGRADAAARGGDRRAAARPRPPPRGRGGRAAARARHGRARARGVRQARGAGDGPLDGAVAVRRARRAVAHAARRRDAAARAAVRDARRPRPRAGDDGDALRHARLPRRAARATATGS